MVECLPSMFRKMGNIKIDINVGKMLGVDFVDSFGTKVLFIFYCVINYHCNYHCKRESSSYTLTWIQC